MSPLYLPYISLKVWKPPGSWGEEWHGLQELGLTTALPLPLFLTLPLPLPLPLPLAPTANPYR